MWHRKHRYMRLDGSSKISARRDMVADFQSREDIFVFLLSTRAGGLGINLTAADTVIFYDSDWNPTVDQQAMDRAHRLGQTKQVTVYRLICKGTIEERILQRAREKSEVSEIIVICHTCCSKHDLQCFPLSDSTYGYQWGKLQTRCFKSKRSSFTFIGR